MSTTPALESARRNAERFHLSAGGYVESGAVGDTDTAGGQSMRWRPAEEGDWDPARPPVVTQTVASFTLADMDAVSAAVRAAGPRDRFVRIATEDAPPPALPWWRSLFTWPTKTTERTPGDAT
jgi:hypothetical protein